MNIYVVFDIPVPIFSALLAALFLSLITSCSSLRALCISYCSMVSASSSGVGTGLAFVISIMALTMSFSCLCRTSMVSFLSPAEH